MFCRVRRRPLHYRLLPYLYIPLQLGLILWAIDAAGRASLPGIASLAVSVGITTGVFGMLTAHEMAHSKSRGERMLATWMLSGMAYRHFRIAHVHFHPSLGGDRTRFPLRPGSAKASMPSWRARCRGSSWTAWRFERKRCAGRPLFDNRSVVDVAATVLILGAIFAIWGLAGAAFFAAQSAVAIVVLELFNYIAHYGLRRRSDTAGRIEPLGDRHSWNSSNVLVNLLIFNMGRHSYHHRRPAAAYESLQFIGGAPRSSPPAMPAASCWRWCRRSGAASWMRKPRSWAPAPMATCALPHKIGAA